MSGAGRRLRAVVLVPNPAAPYSRGLRIARSLAAAGFDVEIAAVAAPGLPETEHDGPVLIRRYAASRPGASAPSGLTARGGDPTGSGTDLEGAASSRRARLGVRGALASLPRRALNVARHQRRRVRRWATWPHAVQEWWPTLRRELPPADLYHACGHQAVGVAVDLAEAARRRGRAGKVVYDVIDLGVDREPRGADGRTTRTDEVDRRGDLNVPGVVRRLFRMREARWVRRVDAIVVTNDRYADFLVSDWTLATRPTVLYNWPPRWNEAGQTHDRIRAATGVSADQRIVLFVGRVGGRHGLEEAAAAVLGVDGAVLVVMGFGPLAGIVAQRDRDPRYAGRHFTLPPVHPDEVPAWVASADVSLIPLPAASLNQQLMTANKLWESFTAGTPVVLTRGLLAMADVVERHRLGAVADGHDAASLAAALRRVVEAPSTERAAMRARCVEITQTRFNWEEAVQPYLVLIQRLLPAASMPVAPGA